MVKRFRTFRLRTLLLIVAIACVGLSVRQRIRQYHLLAQEHHYLALKAGYSAMELQKSSFDRSSLEAVYTPWEQSVHHSRLADYYMRVTNEPWIIVLPVPAFVSLPALPDSDADLLAWWQDNVANHVHYNGLDCDWGTYKDDAVMKRHLAILNVRPSSFNRFLALSHPELFTEHPELLPED